MPSIFDPALEREALLMEYAKQQRTRWDTKYKEHREKILARRKTGYQGAAIDVTITPVNEYGVFDAAVFREFPMDELYMRRALVWSFENLRNLLAREYMDEEDFIGEGSLSHYTVEPEPHEPRFADPVFAERVYRALEELRKKASVPTKQLLAELIRATR